MPKSFVSKVLKGVLNRALAVYGAFANIGAAVGVFVGGVCITHFGARGAFVLNLVFGLANLLAGLMLLPPTVHRVTSQRQLNIPSAMLASLACGLVIFTMTTARRSGVTAPDTLISALLSLGAILAFLRVEAKIRTPLIPVNLLKIPALMTAMLALGFGSAASIGMYVAVGGYLQSVVHFSAQEVGFLFLPSAITATLAGYLVPAVLRRTGPRRGMAAGYAATGFAFIIFTMLKYGMVVPLTIVAMVTHGCGGVLGFTAGLGEVSNVVTPSERGVASALMLTSLSIFASLGGALYGVVLQPQQLGASPKFQNGFWLAVALNLVATTFASYQPKPSKTSCLPG